MTEAEALELVLLASANAVTSFTVYITFTFGYLAAAYFTGKNLTTAQTFILSALYVFSALSAMLNFFSDMTFYAKALSYTEQALSDDIINSPDLWNTYMGILLASGILASLYFMRTVRHGDEDT